MDGYSVVDTDDVPRVDMSEMLDGLLDPDVRRIQSELGTDESVVNVWYFEPGEQMPHHHHDEQEEVLYVLAGEFEVTLGEPGDVERRTVGPGDFWAAGPGVGHGHKYVGDDEGVVLGIGAPNVPDINSDTWQSVDEV
ncbi:MAG: cupin domain-containing protein [Haloarculaceae archaeon]